MASYDTQPGSHATGRGRGGSGSGGDDPPPPGRGKLTFNPHYNPVKNAQDEFWEFSKFETSMNDLAS